MTKYYVADIEADSLNPTEIYILTVCDVETGKLFTTTEYDKMRKFLSQSEDMWLIGHNFYRYDVPVLERLLGIKIKCKVVDTLALSWYLEPERKIHGLGDWGEFFGIPKPKVDQWIAPEAPEERRVFMDLMWTRNREDVKINTKVWERFVSRLTELYGSLEGSIHLIDYLMQKMGDAAEQENSRWKLDVDKCKFELEKIERERETKLSELIQAMPKVPIYKTKKKPAKMYSVKDGSLTIAGGRWKELLGELHKHPETAEVTYVDSYEMGNPNSPEQIKSWLYELGWEPDVVKFVRDKATNEFREIPQVYEKDVGVSSSVKDLYSKEPKLELLDGLSVLKHRAGILKGFLRDVDEDGYVVAKIQGLTNTLRFKHAVCVNMPKEDRIRGCLIAPEGYELCGSDQMSLEDRTKQHYLWNYDPDYVSTMMVDDFDPHVDLAVFAGAMSQAEGDAYKQGDHSKKALRSMYKSCNYAATYGVGKATLARTIKDTEKRAGDLLKAYWKRNWGVKAIAEDCIVKECLGGMWLFNPVSKIWYSLRSEKDRFSTLNQGTGTFLFDQWVKNIRSKRPQLTAQFHDELILTVKKGHRDECAKLLKWAVEKVNKDFWLNRNLDVDIQFGNRYSEIH